MLPRLEKWVVQGSRGVKEGCEQAWQRGKESGLRMEKREKGVKEKKRRAMGRAQHKAV